MDYTGAKVDFLLGLVGEWGVKRSTCNAEACEDDGLVGCVCQIHVPLDISLLWPWRHEPVAGNGPDRPSC